MRKLWMFLVVAALAAQTACFTYVEPGHVGVKIDNGGGGVQKQTLGPGVHFYAPGFTRIEEYPIYMQTLSLAKSLEKDEVDRSVNVTTAEGQPVNLDVSLSFDLNAALVPALYQTFRADIEQIATGYLRNTVRATLQETAGAMAIGDVLGPKKEAMRVQTEQRLTQRLAPYGIVVKQFTINELRPPQAIVAAINAKNAVEQEALRIKNQLLSQEYAARGDSIVAEGRAKATLAAARAEADAISLRADANEHMSRSISPALIEYEKAKRWNGQLPNFMGASVQPYMQIKP